MSRTGLAKMDVRAAWNSWATSGSPEAATEFLDRVASWTDGTAAQLSRGGAGRVAPWPTREELAERLRHQLALVAAGGPVTYLEALEQARREVIAELRISS
jgi:hypothetical protein